LIDHSIKSPEDLKSVSKHRFLGSIPYEKDSLYLSESLRIISTSINNSLIKTNSNSLLVTSALPKDGKTSFSVKLAVAVAKANSRVLVIDGDFRKPSLHKIFNIPNEKGLSNLLSNDNIENSFYETSIKNLFIIPAGVLSSDISELLHSPKLSLFISWAEKNFDKVIVDCAAAINLADSIVYANYIHNLVFVIKSRKTNMYIAQRALKSLEETGGNVIGVVLNMYKDKQLSKYKPYY
jgi:capsular exopolysaccharide synthesis family protein